MMEPSTRRIVSIKDFTYAGLLLAASTLLSSTTDVIYAADVEAEVSTRETYVGLPTVLRVTVNNAIEHETPVFPDVPGLTIERAGPPSRRSQTNWINGRRTQRTSVIYSFLVTPDREGIFTIPPIKISADGVTTMTKAVRVVATKSETGDLLFAEISGNKSKIYVGESLDLTLKFWIRPYRNQEYRVALNEEEMWFCLSDQTSWGLFQNRMDELTAERKRLGGRAVLREDSEGETREYLLYETKTTIYPDRATSIDGQDTRIIFNYPVSLGRSRSPLDIFSNDDFFSGTPFGGSGFGSFGSRLTVTESRPLIAETSVEPIEVLPIPEKGKPKHYVGAVGQYTIRTNASPTKIQTGDPITLTITIEGTGSMDVLRAPDLSRQDDLVNSFKVSDESIAGTVSGTKKTFVTTIRPLRAGVKEIPPIKYSYFDPLQEKFITAVSEPIAIEVKEAEVLALNTNTPPFADTSEDDQVANQSERENSQNYLFTDSQSALEPVQPYRFWSTRNTLTIALPPLVAFILFAVRFREEALTLLPAKSIFQRQLKLAGTVEEVNQALEAYLRRRFRVPPSENERSRLLGYLRQSGHYPTAEKIERLFQSGISRDEKDLSSITLSAQEAVDTLENESRRAWNPNKSKRPFNHPLGLIPLLIAMSTNSSAQARQDQQTTEEQARKNLALIFSEGVDNYQEGTSVDSPETSQRRFKESANAFQTLVDKGIQTDQVHFNLAEAYRGTSETALAIANYRAALAISPTNALYLDRLETLESSLPSSQSTQNPSLRTRVDSWQRLLTRVIGINRVMGFLWLNWLGIWAMFAVSFFTKSAVARAFLLVCVLDFGSSSFLVASHLHEYQANDQIVIINQTLEVREGDGDDFPLVDTLNQAYGKVYRSVQNRGDWILIQHAPTSQGWIRAEDAVQINTAFEAF